MLISHSSSPPSRSALELDCKPVSKKVRKAHIGVTLESEYIKEGVATYVHAHSVSYSTDITLSPHYL